MQKANRYTQGILIEMQHTIGIEKNIRNVGEQSIVHIE